MELAIELNQAIRNLDLEEVERIANSRPSIILDEPTSSSEESSFGDQEFVESPASFALNEYQSVIEEMGASRDETQIQSLNDIVGCLFSKINLNDTAIFVSEGFARAPLCLCVSCPELVEQLLQLGADPNFSCGEPVRERNGIRVFPWPWVSPVACAASEAHSYDLDDSEENQSRRQDRARRSLQLLLEAGAIVDIGASIFVEPVTSVAQRIETDGVSPELAARGLIEVIGMADENACNQNDPVALFALLLDAGLRPNSGHLRAALFRGEQGLAIARLLLDAGVDPNDCGKFGQTPLFALRQRNSGREEGVVCFDEMVSLLEESGQKKSPPAGVDHGRSSGVSAGLSQLMAWMPPPKDQVQRNDQVLQLVIEEIGTSFPEDFLEFVRIYGSGEIRVVGGGQWKIWNPFDTGFLNHYRQFYDIYLEIREDEDFEDDRVGTFELLPAENGILPFLKCDSSGYFGWQVSGPPNTWNTVQFEDDYDVPPVTLHNMTFMDFLVAILRQEIECRFFPDSKWNPETDLTFVPDA